MADVTDKDRELLASFGASELITRYGLCCWKVGESAALKAIAQAREEGRREEREACAKVCEAFDASGAPGAAISTWGEGVADGAEYAKAGCAAAIRARGGAAHSAADAASEV